MKPFHLLFILSLFVVSSCTISLPENGSNSLSEEMNTTGQSRISFNSNGGTTLEPITLIFDNPTTFPSNPTKQGHTFLGWYFDTETFHQPFNLNTLRFEPIAKQVTLHAKWSQWVNGVEQFNFPFFHLNVSSDFYAIDLWNYVPGSLSITNADSAHVLNNEPLTIKGRGNGSWGYQKKGYRIKFDRRISVLGQEASRHWVLGPGGHDFSLMRNHMAYSLTTSLFDGIEYTTSSQFIELFVNGTYHGVYNLFEHVRVQKGRVDIDSDFGVIDTGYLLEYDAYAEGEEGIDYFTVPGLKYPFAIKSPDSSDFSLHTTESRYRQQVNFIRDYVERFTSAVLASDLTTVMELADLDSIIDMYLIHEFFKNTDTGWSSFYLYKKPGGKLFFGPAWDFDFTSGISRGDESFSGLYVGDSARYHTDFTSSEYYLTLMQNPLFVTRVKTRYHEVMELFPFHLERFWLVAPLNQPSFQRDGQRWDWLSGVHNEQRNLKTWLTNRHQWLWNWANNVS